MVYIFCVDVFIRRRENDIAHWNVSGRVYVVYIYRHVYSKYTFTIYLRGL